MDWKNYHPSAPIHLTRHEHLEHMEKTMPILVLLFGLQCLLLPYFFPELSVGNVLILVAIVLSASLLTLYLHHTQLYTYLYQDHLHQQWGAPGSLFSSKKSYPLKDITGVELQGSPEESFASLKISFKQQKNLTLFFLDRAPEVMTLLMQIKRQQEKIPEQIPDHQDRAA